MSQMVRGSVVVVVQNVMDDGPDDGVSGHGDSSPICHGDGAGGSAASVVVVAVRVGVGVAVVVAVSPLCFGLQGFRLKRQRFDDST